MITTFGRVIARKGVKQRFPELVAKEYLLVDVDFIGPILGQNGKEFSQIFLGRIGLIKSLEPWNGLNVLNCRSLTSTVFYDFNALLK